MTLPLLQRTPLEESFAALRKDLIHEDGPQISTMRNYRFAIVQYDPSEEFKLRTVMWDDAGEPIDASLLDDVDRNIDAAIDAIGELLTPGEIEAAHRRALAVRTTGLFPRDPTGQRYPWPLV